MTESDSSVRELNPGIFQVRGLNGSSHSYVIKGRYMNVMIDSGSDQNFPVLERGLFHIGLKVRDINLVINSHEHCDHIGANRYFHDSAMIAAYRLAASKMIAGDYYVTMYKGNDLNEIHAGSSMVGEYDTDQFGQLQPSYLSYAGSYLRLHLDHRDYPRVALFSRQRFCRRHPVLHRRIRQCR
jgi:alkyl sulfatase BDS1-like metallo-beta-lactamase superfamily hydrolase